jgi:predicted nucleic acid-binding protein
MSFVLDNSVAMRWCFKTEAHPYADAILRDLATGMTAIVPTLWFYEASAVLARAQNKGAHVADKAAEFLAELRASSIVADQTKW